jgi:hypothetical protein
MSLQCAPCLSDLALVREAVTSIGGTATCTAHAVLMRYPSDDPQRRRRRLADLRTLAETRVTDATGTEKDRLELLVQEYAVAEAMDLGAPDRTGPGRSERGRRGKERPPREGGREPREPREGREGRPPRDRDRGRRPEGAESTEGATPDTGAPAVVASDVLAAEGGIPAASDSGGADNAPAPTEQSTPEQSTPEQSAPAPAESAPEPDARAEQSTPSSYTGEATPSDTSQTTAEPARDDSGAGTPDLS